MEIAEKQNLKAKIEQQVIETKKDVKNLQEITKPIAPEVSLGRLTRMEAISSKSVNEAALREASEKLLKLESALENIHKPDFGICAVCGAPIPPARIEYIPETTTCVNCG